MPRASLEGWDAWSVWDACLGCRGKARGSRRSPERQMYALLYLRRDTGFLVFSFPRSLGSGFYDEINGGQRKLVCTYLSYIFTKFRPIWISFGARISKTPCQTHTPVPMGLAWCFAYMCTKTNPNRSKFGGDIAQISAHKFLLSSINFVINSTPQGPWE